MTRKKILIFGFVVVVGVLVCAPILRVTISPSVRVRVYDENDSPAKRVLVVQDWEYMSVGSYRQQESVITDEAGYATFPSRSTRTSAGVVALSVLRELASLPHGYGFGRYAQVSAYGADPHIWSFVYCSTSDPPCDAVRMKRWDVALYPRRT
jgi:hypothetical protein